MSWTYTVLEKIQTELDSLDPAPDVIAIVPKGQESMSPTAASTYWITLSPDGDVTSPEPGASYLVEHTVNIGVWIKSNAKAADIVDELSNKIADVRDLLRYNTLAGWARTEIYGDSLTGGDYTDGEDSDSVYGYLFTAVVTRQYT